MKTLLSAAVAAAALLSASVAQAGYTVVVDDDFSQGQMPNPTNWPVRWGNANQMQAGSGLTLTSYASQGWSAVGFMQPDNASQSGYGYGLYIATFKAYAGQGSGICIDIWPGTNVWPGPEIDMVEDWSDPQRQTGYYTIHWRGSDGSNQQDIHQFSLDMTQPHTVALDWEPGVLTYYVDGQQLFQTTGSEVPADYAHGGQNESFNAEVTAAGAGSGAQQVSLTIYRMVIATAGGSTSLGELIGNPGAVPAVATAVTPQQSISTGTPAAQQVSFGTTGGSNPENNGQIDFVAQPPQPPPAGSDAASSSAFNAIDPPTVVDIPGAKAQATLAQSNVTANVLGSHDTLTVSGSWNVVNLLEPGDTVTDLGMANTYVLFPPPAKLVAPQIFKAVNLSVSNDSFDMRPLLATSGWKMGDADSLPNYLSVRSSGAALIVSLTDPIAQNSTRPILILDGAGGLTLDQFLQNVLYE